METIRMGGSTFDLPTGLWRLGSDAVNNKTLNIRNLENIIRTKNICSGNQLTNLETYGISNTSETEKYIKVIKPCSNKNLITNDPEVILIDGSLTEATYRAELDL